MEPRSIPFARYREKVLGCWRGKAVGGTLGGPVEGKPGPLALTFYDPVPDRMLPNDDLDLQVVWLETIRRRGLPVDRRALADAWLEHIHLWPDEYGVACRNLARGLYPPVSGSFDNGFTAGMGAAIRSEIWACLAPGDPALACALAREDACVDHAGEGLHAALYFAALESAAFTLSDREALLDLAQAALPEGSRVARALLDTRRWWRESGDWAAVRARILEKHGSPNFTDVAQNLAFTILGWLAGGGDFGRSLCIAVNCGQDTDCTGATLGALLGILDPGGIGEEWLRPIGRELVLSPGMVGMHHPATLDAFTDQVAALAADVQRYHGSPVTLAGVPDFPDVRSGMTPPRHQMADGIALSPDAAPHESLVATEPLPVFVTYPPGVALAPGRAAQVGVRVVNPTGRDLPLRLRARVPAGWSLDNDDFALALGAGQTERRTVTVTPPPAHAVRVCHNPLDLHLTADGLSWTVTAGLVTTIPWRCWAQDEVGDACPTMSAGAETVEAAGHFQPIPCAEACAWAADVKIPYHKTVRFVVQAPRPVRVWLDGEPLHRHGGTYHVPAIHRAGPTARDIKLRRGWHRLTVAVEPGGATGNLFVGLGDGESWDWLRDAEWRLPTEAAH